jgi:heme exporter protein A
MYGVKAIEEKIKELVLRFDLDRWPSQRVGNLSRGIQQRTAIARALVHEPSILLVDEPETGLDPAALVLLGNVMEELKQRGCTIIATSHNLEFALSTGSRLVMLAGGKFVFESADKALSVDSLRDIFNRYSRNKS